MQSFRIDVVVDAGTAQLDRFFEHAAHRFQQAAALARGQSAGPAPRTDPGSEQRLARIDVADSGEPSLIKQQDFDGRRAAGEQRRERRVVERDAQRIDADAQCGRDVSTLFPNIAECVDDLCFVRSFYTDSTVHAPAMYQVNSGRILMGYPSMGSWITYGWEA